MYNFEKIAASLRHAPALKGAHGMWNVVRPLYNYALAVANPKGLKRNINGTDSLRVSTRARNVIEEYEPEVWRHLMAEIRPGDVIADVGAFIGLYTIALAKRVGDSGRVVAFEPDATNYSILRENAYLNTVQHIVEPVRAVVGTENGQVAFESNGIESHAVAQTTANSVMVKSTSIDRAFAEKPLDILKIDVEGYEGKVLLGALDLLRDRVRGPRAIYIEVHPYAWPETGASSDSLLKILCEHGYQTNFLDGKLVEKIEEYGEIVAYRTSETR